MDYLRDLSDFIDDLPDRGPYDQIVLQLPSIETKLTALLRKLRSHIDAFKNAQRGYMFRDFAKNRDTDQGYMKHTRNSVRGLHESGNASAHNLDANWTAVRQRRTQIKPKRDDRTSAPSVQQHAWHEGKNAADEEPCRPIPDTMDSSRPYNRHDQIIAVPANANPSRVVDVHVSANMSLRCVEISNMNDARLDGTLYYIPNIRRFVIRIAGIVLCGNIGIVYVSDPFPQKIHDCDMQPSCSQSVCRYYHNPLAYYGATPQSKSGVARDFKGDPDIRNFVATSWMYRPCSIPKYQSSAPQDRSGDDTKWHTQNPTTSTAPQQGSLPHRPSSSTSDPKKMRKLASRATLDQDILTITSDDLSYYNEQIMHDILCAILMNYYVRKTPDRVS